MKRKTTKSTSLLMLLLLCLCSCNESGLLRESLTQAGSNRPELERVLEHYASHPETASITIKLNHHSEALSGSMCIDI